MNAVDLPLPIYSFAGGNRCGPVPGTPRFELINRPEDAHPARPVLISRATAKFQAYYYDSPREARWDRLRQGERHYGLERCLEAAGGPDTEEGRILAARRVRWHPQRGERRKTGPATAGLLAIRGRS